MKKFLIGFWCLFGCSLIAGVVTNPENTYIGYEVEMTAIDTDHLKDSTGKVYTTDSELFIGEKYMVRLEKHSDRTIIAEYWEIEK